MDSYLDFQVALTLSESARWAGAAAHAFFARAEALYFA